MLFPLFCPMWALWDQFLSPLQDKDTYIHTILYALLIPILHPPASIFVVACQLKINFFFISVSVWANLRQLPDPTTFGTRKHKRITNF